MMARFMGADVIRILAKQSKDTLVTLRFDNKHRNFTFDSYLARMRNAHEDGEAKSEMLKVQDLLDGFQVPELQHCKSIITSNAQYKNNFDAAAQFIAEQLAMLKTTNGPTNRTLSVLETDPSTGEQAATKKQLTRKLKSLKKQLGKAKKAKGKAHKKANMAAKFTKENPSAYVPPEEWAKMSLEEKALARKARQEQGIPVRGLKALSRRKDPEEPIDVDEGGATKGMEAMDVDNDKMEVDAKEGNQKGTAPVDTNKQGTAPKPAALPSSILKPPPSKLHGLKALVTTQRDATYSKGKEGKDKRVNFTLGSKRS